MKLINNDKIIYLPDPVEVLEIFLNLKMKI